MDSTRRQFLARAATGVAAGAACTLVPRLRAGDKPAIEASLITNRWGRAITKRVSTEELFIYTGTPGQAYSHQAQLISHDGQLYATWSLGLRDEEGPGQRMVMAVSSDQGATWSEPITIAPSHRGRFGDTIVISSGLRIHGDLFIAYYGEWERIQAALNPDGTRNTINTTDHFLHSRTEARTSRDRGRTWSEPIPIMRGVINYMPPAPVHGGRLILPGNLTYPYTDDPAGLTGWRRAALPGVPPDYVDDYFNMRTGRELIGTEHLFTEASFFQTDDRVIHMMLRNQHTPLLGVTVSRDNGETWSKPRLTDYTDAVCRAHFGRMPDGRFFGMSCPAPRPAGATRPGHRTPAVLATSKDGIVFDRHYVLGDEVEKQPRMEGLFKHGRYGYPYLHIMGDRGFVIYSRNKEDIAILRFALSAIS